MHNLVLSAGVVNCGDSNFRA